MPTRTEAGQLSYRISLCLQIDDSALPEIRSQNFSSLREVQRYLSSRSFNDRRVFLVKLPTRPPTWARLTPEMSILWLDLLKCWVDPEFRCEELSAGWEKRPSAGS